MPHSVPKIDYKAHDVSIRSATALAIHQHEIDQAAQHGVFYPDAHNDIFVTSTVGGLSHQVYAPAPKCLEYTVPSSFVSQFLSVDDESGELTCDHAVANDAIISFLQKQQQQSGDSQEGVFPCHIAVAFVDRYLRCLPDGAAILTKYCKCQCPGCPTRFDVHVSAWVHDIFSVNGLARITVRFKDDLRECKHLVHATFGQTRGLAREVNTCLSMSLSLSLSLSQYVFLFRPFCCVPLHVVTRSLSLVLSFFLQRQAGPKPHLLSQQAFAPDKLSDQRLLAGNLQNVPRKHVAQQISSEHNTKHRKHSDLLTSLQLIAHQSEIDDKAQG